MAFHRLPNTNKNLGQHWLKDDEFLEAMIVAGEVKSDDVILEVGPGPGALTELLVKQARRIVAVEFDSDLARALPLAVQDENLEVTHSDILKYDFSSINEPYKVVANIPYYLTAKLVRILLTSPTPPSSITLLIQKEVAVRLAAKPGKMSILGVSAQLYSEVSLHDIVPPEAFTPPPKVFSQIVHMRLRTEPVFSDIDNQDLMKLVRAGFSEKRKKLSNSIAGGLQLEKAEIIDVIKSVGLKELCRAQELTLENWHDLYVAMSNKKFI